MSSGDRLPPLDAMRASICGHEQERHNNKNKNNNNNNTPHHGTLAPTVIKH
jgi:hypothetical protein